MSGRAMQPLARQSSTMRPAPMAPRPRSRQADGAERPGNQAALRRLSAIPARFQAKLEIGAANDPLEHEADRVADAVMGMGETAAPLAGAPLRLSRKCAACEEEEHGLKLQAKRAGAAPAAGGAVPGIVHQVLASEGRPLDPVTRAFFEPRLGYDLSPVRVHAGAAAARSAAAVNALAYTVGHRIVLGSGGADRHLLAHELAHVVQQTGGGAPALRRQEKTIGGPLDLKPDPCIIAPGIGQRCGQEAVGLCEKMPSIPGCGLVCSIFGCTKKNEPKTKCPPGWRAATSRDYAGQCCPPGHDVDSAQNCCPPERVASKPVAHCCAEGEIVDPANDTCMKPSDLPPLPGGLCPPEQKTAGGSCCVPPMVPLGSVCTLPDTPQPQPTPQPSGPMPQFGLLWTDTIHFQQDHPAAGESDAARVLTPAGQAELASVKSWLSISPDLGVRLIGHASSEGDAAYNQALSTRRVRFIAPQLAGRIADPIIGDGAEAGCASLGKGMWSCGESQADQESQNPEDRVVKVTFARNKLPSLTQP
jgi:hypothetical protein